jgi:hypothetical protein
VTGEPGWTDVVVALVAGAAFILSILSLILQWIAWWHSGPRVKVSLSRSVIAWEVDRTQHVLSVTAQNAGRASTQITQWWLEPMRRRGALAGPRWRRHGGNNFVFPVHVLGSAPLPATLDASASLSWMADWDAVDKLASEHGVQFVRPGLALGSGKKVFGDVRPVRTAEPESSDRSIKRVSEG